jgi:hypothetical protein
MRLACIAVFLSCQIFSSGLIYSQEKPAPSEVSGDIEWVFDIAEGQNISQETGKPMFIVFRCER